jgi:hypothetical protein
LILKAPSDRAIGLTTKLKTVAFQKNTAILFSIVTEWSLSLSGDT